MACNTGFSRLEAKAEAIWAKAIAPIREGASEVSALVSEAAEHLGGKDYEKAGEILEAAAKNLSRIDAKFVSAFREARLLLRRDYNAEFGSRVWGDVATKHFDTLVNRSLCVPPEELRQAVRALSETKLRLIAERGYMTELARRGRTPVPE